MTPRLAGARSACAVICAVIGLPRAAGAQRPVPTVRETRSVRTEVRADAIIDRRPTLHAGVGLDTRISNYARFEGVLAAGPRFGAGSTTTFSARADGIVRFVFDPFAQLARAPYVGGGLSVRRESSRTRGDLVALVGVQLRPRRRYAPAFEAGFGGGVRLGLVVRRVR